MNQLEQLSTGLYTYSGRDTAIRLVQYFSLFLFDILNINSLGVISKQFSRCRVIMRLFEDIPAITKFLKLYYYDSGDAKKPMHPYLKWLNYVNLFFWVAYNPVEHLAWLSELELLDSNAQLWWFYTNFCWAGGLFTSVLLNLRVVFLFNQQNKLKAKREDDPKYDSSLLITKNDVNNAIVIACRDWADFMIAVHYLPEGFLWSSQLHYYQIGLLGTFSSLLRVPTYLLGKQN